MVTVILWLFGGIVLGMAFVLYARKQKHQQIKVFEQGLIIAALIYVGFAVFYGSLFWIAIEVSGLILYSLFAILSRKHSLIWIAAAWFAHIFWDLGLHLFGPAHDIAPDWYAWFCLSFDLVLSIYIISYWRKSKKR